jgi:hypothetical protein
MATVIRDRGGTHFRRLLQYLVDPGRNVAKDPQAAVGDLYDQSTGPGCV